MVTFSYPNHFPITLPGASDSAALMQIARSVLFPTARPLSDSDAREYFSQFCAAFTFVACLKRTDDFQGRLGDWTERAESWHQQRGTIATISLSPLACAILAAGDVPWQMPQDRWPFDAYAGLGWTGAAATPAWRDVLRTKTCRPMVPVKQERYSIPHPLIYHPNAG
jgi:hypothetical protein